MFRPCSAVLLLVGGFVLPPGALGASVADQGSWLYSTVSFTREGTVVNGLLRSNANDRASVTQLFIETPGGQLVKMEERMTVEPFLQGVTRVVLEGPEWWMEVRTSYPDFQVESFREATQELSAGERVVVSARALGAELGSAEVKVEKDQNRGIREALQGLVDGEVLRKAVPGEVVEALVLVEAIVGPHGGVAEESSLRVGWQIAGLLGPVLRGAEGGGAEEWQTAVGSRVQRERLGEEGLSMLVRAGRQCSSLAPSWLLIGGQADTAASLLGRVARWSLEHF